MSQQAVLLTIALIFFHNDANFNGDDGTTSLFRNLASPSVSGLSAPRYVSDTRVTYYLSHVAISATSSVGIMTAYLTKILKNILYPR